MTEKKVKLKYTETANECDQNGQPAPIVAAVMLRSTAKAMQKVADGLLRLVDSVGETDLDHSEKSAELLTSIILNFVEKHMATLFYASEAIEFAKEGSLSLLPEHAQESILEQFEKHKGELIENTIDGANNILYHLKKCDEDGVSEEIIKDLIDKLQFEQRKLEDDADSYKAEVDTENRTVKIVKFPSSKTGEA